jgi:hypothetical protein
MWNSLFPFVGMQVGNNWEVNDNYSVYLEILLLPVCSGFVIWLVIKKPKDNFIHYPLLGDYINYCDILHGHCELTIWFVSI